MRFQKINDFKIQIDLDRSDLRERKISLDDLAYGSERTRELFYEILVEAAKECNFIISDSPLMIEAIPMSKDSITIIVTKTEGNKAEEVSSKQNLISKIKEETNKKEKNKKAVKRKKTYVGIPYFIFTFEDIDHICNCAKVSSKYFNGRSILYKYNDLYYLVLKLKSNKHSVSSGTIYNAFCEFGNLEDSTQTQTTIQLLEEHGKIIIKNDTLKKLASI